MFKKLHFNISLAKALALMPKYTKMLKDLLSNKEKLLELANTPLNENCSAVILKKLPEKFGDLGKFLIPYDFRGLESCMALADLGANINLILLSLWKKLSLPELVPTQMTLELANRLVAYPAGIAEDVFVPVGKFTFPADFVVVDYDVDPRVPLILGRPFLRTARALVDVHGEELILRDGEEKLIFSVDNTSIYSHKHRKESINMIDISDPTCEDYFDKVFKFEKPIHHLSGNPTPSSDFMIKSPSLFPTLCGDSDYLLEETDISLSHFDDSPPDYEIFRFDMEEKSSGKKSSGSTTTHSDFSLPEYDSFIFDLSIDPLPPSDKSDFYLEEFTDELAHIISHPDLNPFVEIPSGESKVHIEVLSVLWGNRLPISDGSLPLSRKDKAFAILMVQPWERVAKQKITQSFSPNPEILFLPLGEDEGTKGPMIIKAQIGGHCIHRMYVDGGSASEILYEHFFSRLRLEIKNQLVPTITLLIGFSGEIIWPIGQIQLLVKIEDEEHSTLAWINFVVLPMKGGVITLKSNRMVPLECAMVSGSEGNLSTAKQTVEERIKVAINPEYPEQRIMIGSTLTEEGRNKLCNLLHRNLDIFAWKSADMTDIPRHIVEHGLNVREGCSPVRQKKRGQAADRNQAIQEELGKLVEAEVMKEVHYHDW
ncbi:reverse transcriptase domain-containing protein [Tanacetum coccineum]